MFKHKTNRTPLNKALRIGYLKLKRRYGEDPVQEAAADIWKLTSEEEQRLQESAAPSVSSVAMPSQPTHLSHAFVTNLARLFSLWSSKLTAEENDWITTHVIKPAQAMAQAEAGSWQDIRTFLRDITPVRLRIRKLTPRECGRLMGLSEGDIDTIEASGLSNSAMYRLYGNSIVAGGNHRDSNGNIDGVLFNIFRTLFIEPDHIPDGELRLF